MNASGTAELWRDFALDLRRFLRRQVRDDALADDLLQDVILRVHLHLARMRAPERVAPWLYRIARNLAIDHVRRQAVRNRAVAEPEVCSEGPEPSPETQLAVWMMEQVARFPEPYREALTRVDADGQRAADVARALGLSTPGVKSRVQRARRRLAQATNRCCAVELDRHGRVVDIRRRRPAASRCCVESPPGPTGKSLGPLC